MKKEQLDKARNYRDLNRIAQKGQILFTGSSLMEQFPDAPEWARNAFKIRTNAAIADTNEKVKLLAERFGYQ